MILLSAIIVFTIAFIAYRYLVIKPRLDGKSIDELSITVLPSPPKVKNVTSKDDVEKFVLFFNSIKTKRILLETAKGWQIKVQTKGSQKHTIYFIGEKLYFDGNWYSISSNQLNEMNKLYQSFNYPEESAYEQK